MNENQNSETLLADTQAAETQTTGQPTTESITSATSSDQEPAPAPTTSVYETVVLELPEWRSSFKVWSSSRRPS